MLGVDKGEFIDAKGRILKIRGINFAADAKLPAENSYRYVGSPCKLSEVDDHYIRLKKCGYNCLRYLFTWDALQPEHPDKFDDEYIEFTIAMLRRAIEFNFYIILDPHQDIWSRFSGGSGAPLWTLHAAGFNPKYFNETQAAIIWDPRDSNAIKMQWASNYFRLVCQTMFTLFFGGEVFAPKAQINGVNIGKYLENKYFEALEYFMVKVEQANLGPMLLGYESLNEPGHGLIGWPDLNKLSDNPTAVKLGTAPTPFQGMLLGQGIPQQVKTFKFTGFGIKKLQNAFKVTPTHSTWLSTDELQELDASYGWERSYPGGCIWELHGIYDSTTRKLLKKDYFKPLLNHSDEQSVFELHLDPNAEMFIEHFYVGHWVRFKELVEKINPERFKFMQSPVNAPPPNLAERMPSAVDNKTVYTPHFYDGLTLLLKKWRFLNVDAIGVMRAIYKNPIQALRFGDTRIALSFAEQFEFLKSEGKERLGINIPLIMTEIGIPFDMNHKHAYSKGHWNQQIRAMDANLYGLEIAQIDYCLWCYCVHNTHNLGDNFAGEDLSIWSAEDQNEFMRNTYRNGIRACPAIIRPGIIAASGEINKSTFNMRTAEYQLCVTPRINEPTLVFAPKYYVNNLQSISVSSGSVEIVDEQILVWDHENVLNSSEVLKISGMKRFEHKENVVWCFLREKIARLLDSLTTTLKKQLQNQQKASPELIESPESRPLLE